MKCKVSEMSGDELARSTGQHKQDDHLVPTEHDTSIDGYFQFIFNSH